MKRILLTAATIIVLTTNCQAQSQQQELPKFEVAAEFTTLERDAFSTRRTEPGFGGRFTFNLNRVVSLETAGYYFPKNCFSCSNNGRITEVLGGVKVGKRFEKWGIFAKARPGMINFSKGTFDIIAAPAPPTFFVDVRRSSLTGFATDVGGVVELYVSKRIVTRFDAGDTLIHFTSRNTNNIQFDPLTGTFSLVPFRLPSKTTHNFQFVTSVGFRF
jgi:hypothetical protein